MANKSIHSGHRARMRKEFRLSGFNHWHEHKVLEYILQKALPRVDTNETAHMLIDRCGSFENVFRAPKEQLIGVLGVGEETAEYIHMLGEFVKYYNGVRFEVNRLVLDSESCEGYMLDLFHGKERENLYIICLDAGSRIILREKLFEGSFESLDVDITNIMRIAVKSDASYIVLAHNHPSGVAIPSNADIVSTQTIERALHMGGVKLLDHIIVAGGKCVSMRAGGYLNPKVGVAVSTVHKKKTTK